MGRFLTRERFGPPQFRAGLLLLVYLAQSLWLVRREAPSAPDAGEHFRITEGVRQWRGGPPAGTAAAGQFRAAQDFLPPELEENNGYDPHHSPLWYLVAAAPLVGRPAPLAAGGSSREQWLTERWLEPVPYLLFGVLLGGSLWYVTRRLYGNAGGYIALTLYCFSPAILRAAALWNAQPELGAAFGAFGAIFTAMAVAHTLYAPREVLLWNWRRILLLGISLTLSTGSQFSLIWVIALALVFLLYLAPERRGAAVAIWLAACSLAVLFLFAAYSFHPGIFWQGMRHAQFLPGTWQALGMAGAYRGLLRHLMESSPALVIAMPVTLAAYLAWPRARYFGNTAPLLVAILFLVMGLASPHYPGLGFLLAALPFLFVFVAGVSADLLETRYRSLVLASIAGLLMAYAVWNLMALVPAGWGP